MDDHFGEMLTIDSIGCDPEVINSIDKVNDFMFQAVQVAEMRVIYGPVTFFYQHPHCENENGVSSNLILADSSAATHTFVNNGTVFFDIFSCKKFDRKALKKLFVDTFKPTKVKTSVTKRGKGYKRSFEMV